MDSRNAYRLLARKISWGLFMTVGLALPLSSCSIALNSDRVQCSTTQDCAALGPDFAGLVCSPEQVCVKQAGCSTNQECITLNNGQPYICLKDSRKCVSLVSEDCKPLPTLLGSAVDFANDDTLWFGAIFPQSGNDGGYGIPLLNGVVLAQNDFQKVGAGLPPISAGKPRRPMAFVSCDEATDPIRAITYLVETLKVPAIVGGATSTNYIQEAQNVTIPNNVIYYATAATSPLLTSLPSSNPRLVWRTIGSDAVNGAAMAGLVQTQTEPTIRARYGIAAGTPIKLQSIYSNNAYGRGIDNSLTEAGMLNGKKVTDPSNALYVKRTAYADPSDPTTTDPQSSFASAVADAVSFLPNVIFVGGAEEAADSIIAVIEKQWPTPTAYRPYYVTSEAAASWPSLYPLFTDATERKRMRSLVSGVTNPRHDAVNALYEANIKDGTSPDLAAEAAVYDAVYMLAYATVAVGDQPLTGPAIARGMEKLLPPARLVDVGPFRILDAFTSLSSGQSIDFNGAQGSQDFDITNGEVKFDSTVLCIQPGNTTSFVPSGQIFSTSTNSLQGTDGCQ